MHNGPDFDKLIEPIVEIYQNLEYELIAHIATHFKLYESVGFKNSMEWYANKVAELGGLNQEAIDIISKRTKISKAKIIQMLKEAGISTIDLNAVDKLNSIRDYKIDTDKLIASQPFINIVNNSYKEIDNIFKMIHTNAIQGMQESYMSVLNQAYTEVQSGINDYNSAIRKALTRMANQGIIVASYKQKNGKVINYGIESCVRRDVLTAVVQCTNNASTQFAKDMDAEYYEVSQHLGARVTDTHDYKDHSWWQGKVYKIDGSTKEYPNFQETCNEGDIQGIGGANCRHIKWPFWPGISVPKNIEIDPEENQKIYELNQQQRAYERTIRDYKRQIEVAKESDDVEKYNLYNDKLQVIDKEYNDFCKENNLKRKFNREFVYENPNVKMSSKDVTNSWLGDKTDNIVEATKMNIGDEFKYKGISYIIDGKKVKNEYINEEINFANFIQSKTNKKVILNPTINQPEKIKTPDLTIGKDYVDMKIVSGNSNQLLYHNVRNKDEQAYYFFFETTKSNLKMSDLIQQTNNAFKRNDTNWVKMIGIKKNDKFIILKNNIQKKQ